VPTPTPTSSSSSSSSKNPATNSQAKLIAPPVEETSPQPQNQPTQVSSLGGLICTFSNNKEGESLQDILPKIVNYMHTNGGSLSINVNDLFANCDIGLQSLPGHENLVKQKILSLVSQSIGTEYVPLINIHFEPIADPITAIVEVAKSRKPASIKP
jgi:hypothetical protein